MIRLIVEPSIFHHPTHAALVSNKTAAVKHKEEQWHQNKQHALEDKHTGSDPEPQVHCLRSILNLIELFANLRVINSSVLVRALVQDVEVLDLIQIALVDVDLVSKIDTSDWGEDEKGKVRTTQLYQPELFLHTEKGNNMRTNCHTVDDTDCDTNLSEPFVFLVETKICAGSFVADLA